MLQSTGFYCWGFHFCYRITEPPALTTHARRAHTHKILQNHAVAQDKRTVWRFESPLPDLQWELVDLP
jgi:hypothetical protein